MSRILKFLTMTTGILLLVGVALIQRIDRTPYQETEHFRQWKAQLVTQSFDLSLGSIQVGWAKENFTPAEDVPMAGYGNRWGKSFEGVDDSLYVRVIAVQSSAEEVMFMLSADMLIIPPNVTAHFENQLAAHGIDLDQVHMGATHTHHGFGGWGQKAVGRLFAGKYDSDVEIFIAESFTNAILNAREELVPAQVYYVESLFEDGVRNRLKVPGGTIDGEVRNLVFDREDGKRAVTMTYAAHSTTLPSRHRQLSRDYPGAVVDLLENKADVDFAMFVAGAMGSMSSDVQGDTPFDRVKIMADSLVTHFSTADGRRDSAAGSFSSSDSIDFLSIGMYIPIPSSTGRISKNYALRPWFFKMIGGESPAYIKVSLLDNTLILGMPADFSGEIMKELDAYASSKGLDLMITGFNGQYLGYITPDKIYDEDLYETVTMSWNGYQAGGYFTQVSKDIIDAISEQKRMIVR